MSTNMTAFTISTMHIGPKRAERSEASEALPFTQT